MHLKRFFAILYFLVPFCVNGQKTQIDSLYQEIELSKKIDTNYINLINKLGYAYYSINPDSTIILTSKAYLLSNKFKHVNGIISSTRFLGLGYYAQSKYSDALNFTFKSVTVAKKFNKQIDLAAAYNNIGLIYEAKEKNNYAKFYYKQSLGYYKNFKNNKGYGNALNNLGNIYIKNGNLPNALKYHLEALSIRENLKDKFGLSFSYNNIGNIYFYQKNYQVALNYYLKSLRLRRELRNKFGEASVLNNIGLLYLKINKFQNAENYYQKAINVSQSIADLRNMANSYEGLGALAESKGQNLIALKYYQKALEIATSNDNQYIISQIHRGIAKTYYNLNQHDNALNAILKALNISKKISHQVEIRDNYKLMSKIYEQKGNYKKSLESFQKFDEYEEMLNNDEVKKKLVQLSTQYEFDKKSQLLKLQQDKRNAVYEKASLMQKWIIFSFLAGLIILGIIFIINNNHLAKVKKTLSQLEVANQEILFQKEEINKQKESLANLNNTKDKLFSIISHDMRSPISNLSALMDMVIEDDLSMEEFKKFAPHLQSNLHDISETLENLLVWSYGQINGVNSEPNHYNLYKSISKMISLYKNIAHSKNIVIQDDLLNRDVNVFADENQVKVVFRNLINNAIKFTPPNGLISISSTINQYFLKVAIKDTGLGMNEEKLSKLFASGQSTVGKTGERGMGLGLILCKDMIEQIGGTISVESEVDKGSCFSFTIPLSNLDIHQS